VRAVSHIRFMTFPQTNVTSATGRKATPISFICKRGRCRRAFRAL